MPDLPESRWLPNKIAGVNSPVIAGRDISASLGLHVALAVVVGFWTPVMTALDTNDALLPVEIVTVEEFTRLTRDKPKKEILEKEPAPAKPAPPVARETAPPPPVPAEAMPLAEPVREKPPVADTFTDPVEKAPAETSPISQLRPVARPAPPRPKPVLDVSQIRALLNKTPDTPAEAEPVAEEEVASENIRLTLNEIDAFRTQMRRCWNPPSGARNAEDLIVQVRVSLAPNGMISAGPKVMNRTQLGDPFFRAAAESVLRAIRRCQPFEMPPEKYAAWRDIELKFDPGKMLGG